MVDVETAVIKPMFRITFEVKRFDEFGGECECIDDATEAKEGLLVAIILILEAKRCE
jgi:hypothetical protein